MPRGTPLRLLLAVTLAAAVAAAHAQGDVLPAEGPDVGGSETAIFFYPWYGTPKRDGAWAHWTQNRHVPPYALPSAYYPARGPYSSSDPAVLAAQLDEIARAGVDTVVVSWWGPGSTEDARLPAVSAAARARGLRVAVHVEPYGGRTPDTVARDAALLRPLGVTDLYVYDSPASPDAEWAAANARLPGVRLFAHTALAGKAHAGGFDGLYTYDVLVHDGSSFRRLCAAARRLLLLCAPSVGPGFDSRRATGEQRTRPRRAGATYDGMWRSALRARADVVTITSYNEWHEGTQIEPARAVPGYASYDGAWALRGETAERSYLERTAVWAAQLDAAAAGQ